MLRHKVVVCGFVSSGLGRFIPRGEFPMHTDPAWMETFHDEF
jgi:hypothetical protein